MAKHINIEIDEDDHERLSEIKDEHGMTWYGMLLSGEKYLEGD